MGKAVTIGQSHHKSKIIRAVPFDPAKFIDKGYTIWRGPSDGYGLEGEEEQDARSLVLKEVELSKLLFETCLQKGESLIKGKEKLKRLKSAGRIRLDARFGAALYKEPGYRTLEWLRANRGIAWVDFPGTTIRVPFGHQYVLDLYFGGSGWYWYVRWLENDWNSNEPSVKNPSEPLGS